MTFSGRSAIGADRAYSGDAPLIIAIPGGTYTSAYFDLPGRSLLDRAAALGVPCLALDRPGYGDSTPVVTGDSIILANAEVLDDAIGDIWGTVGAGNPGIVLVGHSIGGAVVSAIAARRPSWPLLGIAISGCLLQVPAESRVAWDALPDLTYVQMPDGIKNVVMFGPEWTLDSDMPGASHQADSPVPKAELLDITGGWIERVRSTVARIAVPVHARQGEFDKLWITDQEQMAEFAAAFTGAPSVDARLTPSAGHCIDFHRPGDALQLEQLAFALNCAIRPT
jgi:pimeloyl-ACP methyl ester carboxylesterase